MGGFTTEMLDRAISSAFAAAKEPKVMMVHPRVWVQFQQAVDRFRIMAHRKALRRAGVNIPVDRGREWWM